MTCVELMDIPDVRAEALSDFGPDQQVAINKLSDTLGFMWRKGLLTRYPAPPDTATLARYAYQWLGDAKSKPAPSPVVYATPKKKPSFLVREYDDGIMIEFDSFTVMVKQK